MRVIISRSSISDYRISQRDASLLDMLVQTDNDTVLVVRTAARVKIYILQYHSHCLIDRGSGFVQSKLP